MTEVNYVKHVVMYLDKEEYPNEYILSRAASRGLSPEQDYYRHRAFLFKCILFGNKYEIAPIEMWAVRLRDASNFKFKWYKQIWWIVKSLLKKG